MNIQNVNEISKIKLYNNVNSDQFVALINAFFCKSKDDKFKKVILDHLLISTKPKHNSSEPMPLEFDLYIAFSNDKKLSQFQNILHNQLIMCVGMKNIKEIDFDENVIHELSLNRVEVDNPLSLYNLTTNIDNRKKIINDLVEYLEEEEVVNVSFEYLNFAISSHDTSLYNKIYNPDIHDMFIPMIVNQPNLFMLTTITFNLINECQEFDLLPAKVDVFLTPFELLNLNEFNLKNMTFKSNKPN